MVPSNFNTPQETRKTPPTFNNKVTNLTNFSLNPQFHRSMPFNQPNYYSCNQGYQSQSQHFHKTFSGFPSNFCGSLPFEYKQRSFENFSKLGMNCYYNSSTGNITSSPSLGRAKIQKPSSTANLKNNSNEKNNKKQNKKKNIFIDFNSLEELLEFLKGGKQIGNYIKCRTNTATMINLIKKLPSEKIGELIDLIKHKLKDIMISNNKFCQKLFEQCTAQQRIIILNVIKDKFVEIAFNKWGSYSLQALVKIVSLPEEQEIIKQCIKGRVYELSMDKQSNFVLQKLILLLNEKGMVPITDEIFQIFNHLLYNSNGICLLKNLILTNKSSETRKKFVQKVIENLPHIINHQIGHTLLIQMMDKWDFETCKSMIQEILKDILKYSLMRYSSVVVMKCISISDSKLIKSVCTNILKADIINQIIKNYFGKEILKELFSKLPRKVRLETIANLEIALMDLMEKKEELTEEESSSFMFLEELSQC